MAVTFTAAGAAVTNSTATSTISLPYPAGMSSTSVMVLWVLVNSATVPSLPSGWASAVADASSAGTQAPSILVCVKQATGSESGNFSLAIPSGKATGQIIAFDGVDTSTILDVTPSVYDTTGAVSTVPIPGVSTTTTGTALVYVAGQNNTTDTATAPTSPGAFTETGDNTGGQAGAAGYLIWSGSGATGTVSVAFSGSARPVGALLALRPGTGSSNVTVTQPLLSDSTAHAAPAGTVAAVRNVTVAGVLAALSMLAPAGTVSSAGSATVAGVTATVSDAAPAGTVGTVRNVTLTPPGAATATETAPAGTVAAGAAKTVAGVTAAVTGAAPAGAVATGATAAGPAATITTAAPAGTVATVATVTLAGPAATVSTAAHTGGASIIDPDEIRFLRSPSVAHAEAVDPTLKFGMPGWDGNAIRVGPDGDGPWVEQRWTAMHGPGTVTTQATSYAATTGDWVIVGNGSSITVTLLDPATVPGRRIIVKNINASSLTVATAAGTIDGGLTVALAQWAKVEVVSDGTNWLTI